VQPSIKTSYLSSLPRSFVCHSFLVRGAAISFFVLLAIAFSGSPASAQTGFTGIFGGGPFYKGNVGPNITEIENSGFTEAIVWSVEVSSTGDLMPGRSGV